MKRMVPNGFAGPGVRLGSVEVDDSPERTLGEVIMDELRAGRAPPITLPAFLLAAALSGCQVEANVHAGSEPANVTPDTAWCEAFDWHDSGRTCRMLWCRRINGSGGGLTTLWCDPAPARDGGAR